MKSDPQVWKKIIIIVGLHMQLILNGKIIFSYYNDS